MVLKELTDEAYCDSATPYTVLGQIPAYKKVGEE